MKFWTKKTVYVVHVDTGVIFVFSYSICLNKTKYF